MFELIGNDTEDVRINWVIRQLRSLPAGSRIIKPGGTLLVTAPFSSLTHFAPYHFCGYNRYWWMRHLPAQGLEIETIDHNGCWFAFIAQELRRSRQVGRMYSSRLLGLITRVAAIPLLLMLTLSASHDRGSQELLCFGFMVRATKVTNERQVVASPANG